MIKRIMKIIVIFIIFILISNIVINKNEKAFFSRTHFAYWNLDYPELEEIMRFKSERSFGNDFSDSIVFSSDENLKRELKLYIIENESLLVSEGDEGSEILKPDLLKIFHDFSDNSSLEKRINSYDSYAYWIFEKNNGSDKLGILMSENEVVFLFIKI